VTTDLYPGEAKPDRREAFVIADTARLPRRQVHWPDTTSTHFLDQLRVLNSFDVDLAADLTRLTSRLRDALTSMSAALERAVASRLSHNGVRDLLAQSPRPTGLRRDGAARVAQDDRGRLPRLAGKVAGTVAASPAAPCRRETCRAATPTVRLVTRPLVSLALGADREGSSTVPARTGVRISVS
jgi:hypothetical protein